MRRFTTLVAAATLVLPLVAFAQPGSPPGDGPGHRPGQTNGRHGGPLGFSPGFLAEVLEMTEDQIADMEEILALFRDEVEPLGQAINEARAAVAALLDGPDPDPTTVGELTIEIHALRGEVEAARDAAVEAIEGLLTQEQLDRWEVVKDVLRALKRPRHGGDPGEGLDA